MRLQNTNTVLADILRDELERRGWSLRDLSRATQEAAERLSELGICTTKGVKGEAREDRGLSPAMLSILMTKEVDPNLHSLRLLSIALNVPMRRFLLALGFDPDAGPAALVDRRSRIASILEAAVSLDLVEQVMSLPHEDQRAVSAFIQFLGHKKEERD